VPDVPVSDQDVQGLADKLGALDSELSDSQRALLVGLIAVAGDAVQSETGLVQRVPEGQAAPISIDAPEPLPSPADVFRNAFTPGQQTDIGGAAAVKWEGTVSIKVSGG
jgi:hypothetical protein